MHCTKYLILSVVFCIWSNIIVAQSPVLKHLTTDDGLPGLHVYEVNQDREGYYWISTSEGLARYDGYNFQQFGIATGLPYDDIWKTYHDDQGRTWIRTFGNKLYYLENDSLSYLDVAHVGIPTSAAMPKFFIDKSGNYVLIDGTPYVVFNDQSFCRSYPPRRFGGRPNGKRPEYFQSSDREVYCIMFNPITVFKIAPEDDLQMVHQYTTQIYQDQHYLPDNDELNEDNVTVAIRSPDSLFVIEDGFITAYVGGEQKLPVPFPAAHQMKTASYKTIYQDGKYFFLKKGSSFATDFHFNHLPQYDFIAPFNVNSVFVDREGSLWVYTFDEGIYFVAKDAANSKSYGESDDFEGKVVALTNDDRGRTWVALKDGTICLWRKDSILCQRIETTVNYELGQFIQTMEVVNDQILVLTERSELQSLQILGMPQSGHLFKRTNISLYRNNAYSEIKSMCKGAFNNIYVTGLRFGFRIKDTKKFSELDTIVNLERSYAMMEDLQGNVYVGTTSGLVVHSSDKEFETRFNSLKSNITELNSWVTKLKIDSKGRIWAASQGGGIYRIADGKISVPDCSAEWVVNDLYMISDDTIWLATDQGAIRIVIINDDKSLQCSAKVFTTANGLIDDKTTAICSDNDFVYVGTSKGVTLLDKASIEENMLPPEVQIKSVAVNGVNLPVGRTYNLAHDENALTIGYTCISPRRGDHISYQYMLAGLDKNWQKTDALSISYPYLPAGEYTFQIQVIDQNGITSEKATFQVAVDELWYKKTAVQIAAVGTLMLILFGIFLFRIRQIKQREQQEATLNRKFAQLELKALQAQMNPHFVFNVLHGIQDYILNSDQESANRYLVEFSSLMRLFLEASDSRYIRLDKEVKLLKLYVGLEQMRFENKFNFELKIDDQLDQYMLSVPSMLLQPIVENAISHGLKYKTDKGSLSITIREPEEGLLHVTIEDDGIGRKKSEEIKKKTRKGHISKGEQLVKDRLETLRATGEANIDLIYTDLMDGQLAKGTRVELIMNLTINK